MSKIKRIVSLLLALVMLFAVGVQLTSCGEDPVTSTDGGGNTTDPSGNATYSVTVKSQGGLPLEGVLVYACKPDGSYANKGVKTDASGVATFTVPALTGYTVELSGVPAGYHVAEKYDLFSTGTTITLTSSLVTDEDIEGKQLGLGSIMYDFEVTDTEGNKIKLSEILKTKKAVMLNFWYTTCTYCVEEFPDMNAAYEQYKDRIEIIALNNYGGDNAADVKDFKKNYYGYELSFPMAKDTAGVEDCFNLPGNPVSVIIDRYGMVSLMHVGAIPSEKYFTNMFDHYLSDDYKQGLYGDVAELIPAAKPDLEMPSSEELSSALNKGDIKVTYSPETDPEDAEYSWPFKITEKNGKKCVMPANKDLDSSYAILYANVELKKDEAFVFDYFASSQAGYDILYIVVEGNDIYQISGSTQTDWKECCPWVATEDGTYEVGFVFVKDISDSEGDDTVYLKDFRVVNKSEVTSASYIPREAATNPTADMSDYRDYVTVVLGDDGYYHVGTKNGPILLANLIYGTNFSDSSVTQLLYDNYSADKSVKELLVNGKNVYLQLEKYCNYASNSKIYAYCSVTEELATYLKAIVAEQGTNTHENTWLRLCMYYDAYGKDESGAAVGQFEDPIKGLACFNAYEAVLGSKNEVTYIGTNIMPRGYLFKFVPETTGVYRVTTKSSQEVIGWMYVGDDAKWIDNGDRILYTHSDVGERFNPDLLVEDKDGNIVRDTVNASMVAYMEAGKAYYIDFAYYDVYGAGTFNFEIKFLAEGFTYFIEASPGPFTYELGPNDSVGETIAGGIDVILGDDGYYRHKLPDGSAGSILYADFFYTTNIFPSNSLQDMIDKNGFNFAMSENDHHAVSEWEKAGKDEDALKERWGEDFDYYWNEYKMEDILKGKYHGNGKDYTEVMRGYAAKMLNEADHPERQGCVPVDEELAEILQALVDKYVFQNVEHSWTKLCYYYEYLGTASAE